METIRVIISFLFILAIQGCSNAQKKEIRNERYAYEIYELILSDLNYLEYSAPIPAPPLRFTKSYSKKMYGEIVDSINFANRNRKLKISLSPKLMGGISSQLLENQKYTEYKPLIKELELMKDISLDTSKLRYNKNKITVILTDSIAVENNKQHYFENHDLLIAFSTVAFNDNFTKAIVEKGVTVSRLDAFSTLFFLERKNDEWKIVHTQ